jgi:hypothetical protein
MSGNRDKTPYRFDLLIPDFLERMGEAMGEGHEKYDDDRFYPNWQYGLAEDKSPINHMYAHLLAYHRMANDNDNLFTLDERIEHLAHLACNAMMEYWYICNGVREADGPEPEDFLGFAEHDQPTAADLEEESEVPTATTFAPPPPSLFARILEKFPSVDGKVSS